MLLRRLKQGAGAFPLSWKLISGVTSVHLALAAVAFLKDLVFAAYLGTSSIADAINSAYLIPESIGYNLVAAVIGIAAVPTLSRCWTSGRYGEYWRTVLKLLIHMAAIMSVFTIFVVVFRNAVFNGFGFADDGDTFEWLRGYYLLLAPSLVLYPICHVGVAALQATRSFYLSALAPIVLNGTMLLALAIAMSAGTEIAEGGWLYSASILAGALFMTLFVWSGLLRKYIGQKKRNAEADIPVDKIRSQVKEIYANALPLLFVIGFSQALYAVERALASHFGTGTLAALNYAYRVAQFPNWVFVAAITAVMLPAFSSASNHGVSELKRVLKVTVYLLLPASLLLFAVRMPVVTLLFQRGAFDENSVQLTSQMLAGYALSIVGAAISAICLRYFLAQGRMKGAVLIHLVSAFAAILFDALAMEDLGPSAIGYGSCVGWSCNAIMMIVWAAYTGQQRKGAQR